VDKESHWWEGFYKMKISVFPKCYMDEICVYHTMTIFDWIEDSKVLGAEGLEMYEGSLQV